MSAGELRYHPGDRIGDHVLEEPIGRGGFSEVWRARTEALSLDRPFTDPHPTVAIKLLVNADHVAELKQEARALAIVGGEGIVKTFAANLEHEPPYLVLEYHQAGDLRSALTKAGGKLAPARALWLVERVLGTLARVHREGIVHGDLKPENVLFDAHGNPLLADFGLSRRILQKTGTLSMSLSRADARLAGTIDYMAPEQREGQKATLACDVYAAGVLLHELIFGERPQGVSRKPTERDPRLPPLVDRVLEHALALDPRDRYADASAFLTALRFELWNDARELGSISKGVRERVVLAWAWTIVWSGGAIAAWGLTALAGPSGGREGILGRFDLDLATGSLAVSLPLLVVLPLVTRWRRKLEQSVERTHARLETLRAWREVSSEAPPETWSPEVIARRARNDSRARTGWRLFKLRLRKRRRRGRGRGKTSLALKLAVLGCLALAGLVGYRVSLKVRHERALAAAIDRAAALGSSEAITELGDFLDPAATVALIDVARRANDRGVAWQELRRSVQLFAAFGEIDPAVRGALLDVGASGANSRRLRLLAFYLLEELDQPTYAEPAGFSATGALSFGGQNVLMQDVIDRIARETSYSIDAGGFGSLHRQFKIEAPAWICLAKLSQRVSARVIVSDRKIRLLPAPSRTLSEKLGKDVRLPNDEEIERAFLWYEDPLLDARKFVRALARLDNLVVRETETAIELVPR